MKIDGEMNVTAHRITNNIGKMYLPDENGGAYKYTIFDDEYMWLWVGGKLYGVKYMDSTQVIETPVTTSNYYEGMHHFSGGIIGIRNGSSYTNYRNALLYDTLNNTIKYTNGYSDTNVNFLVPFADRAGAYIQMYHSSNATSYSVVKDVRYLATINNLPEPVVKTANKTMKVIYTLTREA